MDDKTKDAVKVLVLELLQELFGSSSIRIGGTESGSWADYALDQEAILKKIECCLKQLQAKK